MVIGMFLVNSAPASVLFDSSASHSFITAEFVAKHSIPMCTMPKPMLVSSPGGRMKAAYICPKVNLKIMEVDFPANQIVLNSSGIDVILGMYWMGGCNGVINCAKRSMQLTSPQGDRVEFVATLPSAEHCVVNQLEGTRLEDVRVVCVFPNVFPDDLPGMPSDRDIEFVIDLYPGTTPISKRPYRMAVNELEEFKKTTKRIIG